MSWTRLRRSRENLSRPSRFKVLMSPSWLTIFIEQCSPDVGRRDKTRAGNGLTVGKELEHKTRSTSRICLRQVAVELVRHSKELQFVRKKGF